MPSHLQPPLWRRSTFGSPDTVVTPASLRGATLHELLGAISHEVRGPLTLLRGETALLRRKAADAGAVREASAALDRQVSQIAGFLQDLMALADDGETVQPETVSIRVSELLEGARRSLEEVFDQRLSHVMIAKPDSRAMINGDRDRLQHALRSILVTLAGAASLRGDVLMRATTDAQDVVIAVTSRGAQIAPDLLPTLFDPFIRGLYGLRADGVSLAAARRTIATHGGSIKVQNTDSGTEFLLRLPRAGP